MKNNQANNNNNNVNVRNIVLNMLGQTIDEGRFSHLVLADAFAANKLQAKDKAFLNRLYMGTLEKLIFLDYIISKHSKVTLKKMKPVIRNILRMSIYQIVFMGSVPNRAAIDEAVKLTKKRGMVNLSGFVNGILRNAERFIQGDYLPEIPDHVRYSLPVWLYNLVIEQYGKEKADLFFSSINNVEKGTTVRFNLVKSDADAVIQMLEADGCSVKPLFDNSEKTEDYYTDHAYSISGFESLTELKAFKKGLIIMQDVASMKVAEAGYKYSESKDSVKLILDVCSAPGGKSLYLAEMFPDAAIISRDLTDYKVGLIGENIKRLGINNITAQTFDATIKDEVMVGKADIVVADVPCSGLGVIGHKPDIIARVKAEDLAELSALQRSILSTVKDYVKEKGILVYSTCTINKGENADNILWFLSQNPEFTCLYEKQFLTGEDKCDGFYIAVLKK